MLHEFLVENKELILQRARTRIQARGFPVPTEEELSTGIPIFFEQLVERLRRKAGLSSSPSPDVSEIASNRGADMLRFGVTASQVVHDYGSLWQAVTELALQKQAAIGPEEYQVFNSTTDDAIAAAVTEYNRRHEEIRTQSDSQYLGFLAHEMRNSVTSALLAFQAIRRSQLPISGSTAGILERSLSTLRNLIDSSLAEARLSANAELRKSRFRLADAIEEVEAAFSIDAGARGVRVVRDVDFDVTLEADRALIISAISNLLQNALKFTSAGSTVTMRTLTSGDRVKIEIEDECGGLPPGTSEKLFQPFTQESMNKTGAGLGLAIARRSIEAHQGVLTVRDKPNVGCVFVIDVPRTLAEEEPLLEERRVPKRSA